MKNDPKVYMMDDYKEKNNFLTGCLDVTDLAHSISMVAFPIIIRKNRFGVVDNP